MPALPSNSPISNSHFTLDASGVAGFFGGDEAISAMATVHLYKGRRWFGWYNSPGSYTVAKRYGQLANSRFWDGVFPGTNMDPATAFGLTGKEGPKYIAAYSGTIIERTGHTAYLTDMLTQNVEVKLVETRDATPMTVTVVTLPNVASKKKEVEVPLMSTYHALVACIPIIISVSACVGCAFVRDWYPFAMILLGIVANGLSCFVIGSAHLVLQTFTPADGAPPGDGILLKNDAVIVLKGAEKDVNAITKGAFVLKMQGGPEYRAVGLCSLLLVAQFLLQLLLIPQATLFGQIMFVSSLAVSWLYTLFLSSLEKEKLQAKLLHAALKKPQMAGFKFLNRTAAAVFSSMVLSERSPTSSCIFDSGTILDSFIPNNTRVWVQWKRKVTEQLEVAGEKIFDEVGCDLTGWSEGERRLLRTLLNDAQQAYDGYKKLPRVVGNGLPAAGTVIRHVGLIRS